MRVHRVFMSFAISIGCGIASQNVAFSQEYRGTAEQQMACTPDVWRLCGAQIPQARQPSDPFSDHHTFPHRGFLHWRFAYAGPGVRRATVVGPASANLHNSRHSPRLLTLNREAPHCAARLPTWQNNPLGETVPGMQGLKRVGRDRVGTLSSSIAVLQ